MIARAGSGWQTVLADLSLILFMVTASALSQAQDDARTAVRGAPRASARSEPLAIWRDGEGAPPLDAWLTAQSADARQQLTVVARYEPGRQGQALAAAQVLLTQAGQAAATARVVVEPGAGGTMASLAYDVPDAGMARPLQSASAMTTDGEPLP